MAAGALIVSVVGNLATRYFSVPAATCHVPGILLLVPGSVGFQAVSALMAHDVTVGIDTAFATAASASALVGGALLGNAVAPATRSL